MPRRRYYRRYTRVVAPKKKWATNMKTGILSKVAASGSTEHVEDVLVTNSTQTASPTPVVVKTGNFKIQGDCYLTSQSQGNPLSTTLQVVLYVMYLPEVVVAQANATTAIQDHPEWIMAWKVVDLNFTGTSSTSNGNSFSFSSRLKRNLNSGDAVALVAVIQNGNSGGVQMLLRYAVQYWTCSN